MNIRTILFLCFLAVSLCRADEKLPMLKVGSEVYSNVTVTSVSKTDIFFTHSQGMGNAKLKDLDPEMQKHFHFDAAKVNALAQLQKAEDAQFRLRMVSITNTPPNTAAGLQKEVDRAIVWVKEIVNQPVRRLARTPDMSPGEYPYWFHPGANTPDFNTVDIRSTQQLDYAKFQYVTSDLNPGVVFVGAELEFNSNTKYFYTDRSLPKKKLTEPQMLEINRLYRIIGQDEDLLAKIPRL
ncbi:MAG TPA: hypothetical protein VH255_08670 [Verrucomicrobiae bacterium]|nr:hypothetical protein [Verrucomicrobiae bacterium]